MYPEPVFPRKHFVDKVTNYTAFDTEDKIAPKVKTRSAFDVERFAGKTWHWSRNWHPRP